MSLPPPFRYTEAILCRIPDTLPRSGTPTPEKIAAELGGKKKAKKVKAGKENSSAVLADVDLAKCRAEFDMLANVLREIGLDVVELPPDNSCPLSFLVGDVAFVLNGMGLVTRPKSKERQTEVNTIRTQLKNELDIPVAVVDKEDAYIEGADILFTGKELFVGISDFTNVAGARFLANTFPEYPCSPIRVPGPFHLTHYVNMASPDLICVGAGQDSQDIIKRMEREAEFRYQTLTVPEDQASNILFVNGTLIHLSSKEIPNSYKVFSDKLVLPRRTVELPELSKLAANIPRLVLLLNKSKAKAKSVRP